jgi:hypothetical protein
MRRESICAGTPLASGIFTAVLEGAFGPTIARLQFCQRVCKWNTGLPRSGVARRDCST